MYERYYMTLRIDIKGDNADKAIQKLNEKIEDILTDESKILASNGYHTAIGWNWSKHINV